MINKEAYESIICLTNENSPIKRKRKRIPLFYFFFSSLNFHIMVLIYLNAKKESSENFLKFQNDVIFKYINLNLYWLVKYILKI